MLGEVSEQIIAYEDINTTLSDAEREVFVSDGKCRIFQTRNNKRYLAFFDKKSRLSCIQMYLAYHSKNIKEKIRTGEIINVKFSGDRELFNAVFNPDKCYYNFLTVEKVKEEYSFVKEDFKGKEDMNDLIVAVFVPGTQTLFYFERYQVSLFQLYTMVERPQKLYDGRIVYLTMLERTVFLAPEVKTTFYLHNEKYEPVLLEKELRDKLLTSIINKLEVKSESGTIYHIELKNGDRDIIKLVNNISVDYPFFNQISLDSLSSHPEFERLKEGSWLIDYYKPGTETISSSTVMTL